MVVASTDFARPTACVNLGLDSPPTDGCAALDELLYCAISGRLKEGPDRAWGLNAKLPRDLEPGKGASPPRYSCYMGRGYEG